MEESAYLGPSAGFLFLYPVVAFGIGFVRDQYFNKINFAVLFVTTLVIGVLFLDIVGTIIMGFIIHIPVSKAFLLSFTLCQEILLKPSLQV